MNIKKNKNKNLAILKIFLFLILLLCFTTALNNETFSNDERKLHDLFTDLIKCKGKCTYKEKQEAEDKIDKYYEDEIKRNTKEKEIQESAKIFR